MRVKSKVAICKGSKIVFNKIEIYISKKIQIFQSDNAEEY